MGQDPENQMIGGNWHPLASHKLLGAVWVPKFWLIAQIIPISPKVASIGGPGWGLAAISSMPWISRVFEFVVKVPIIPWTILHQIGMIPISLQMLVAPSPDGRCRDWSWRHESTPNSGDIWPQIFGDIDQSCDQQPKGRLDIDRSSAMRCLRSPLMVGASPWEMCHGQVSWIGLIQSLGNDSQSMVISK